MVKKIALILIRFYQKTLSLDHGPLKRFYPVGYCKFSPTCSMYTYDAVEKFGVLKGFWLGIKRVGRCNPYHEGGHDPIPNK